MIRVEHEQGSEVWKTWRLGGIGGSDAAVILGVAPAYWANSTRRELLEYKAAHQGGFERTTEKNKTAAMLRGTNMEPMARQAYRDRTGNAVEPACVIHDTHNWLRASCDGLNKDGDLVLEIKCVNWRDHEQAINGSVPAHYWPQVQHLLLVTGAPKLHYWSFSENKKFAKPDLQALVAVRPSAQYQKYLFEEEAKFWLDLQELIRKKKKK